MYIYNTSRTRVHRIPDIAFTNQRGIYSGDNGPAHNETRPLQCAHAGESEKKINSYAKFKEKCRAEDPHNPKLHTKVTPVVFGTYGAAGRSAVAMMDMARHQFSTEQLECEDTSAVSIFYSDWAHRISTTLQVGNAKAIFTRSRGADARTAGDRERRSSQSSSVARRPRQHLKQPPEVIQRH